MKKLFIMMAALFAGVSMSAQMKGDISISGNFLLSGGNSTSTVTTGSKTETEKEPATFKFGAGVSVGYFFAENCEVSLGLKYGLKRDWLNWRDSDAKKKLYDFTNEFTVTPGLKYYVSIVDDVFYYTPNINFGLGFNSGKTQQSDTQTVKKENLPFVFNLDLNLAAFEFKPSYNVGITFSIGGIYYTNKSSKWETGSGDTLVKYKESENTFKVTLDQVLSPEIGVKFYFF